MFCLTASISASDIGFGVGSCLASTGITGGCGVGCVCDVLGCGIFCCVVASCIFGTTTFSVGFDINDSGIVGNVFGVLTSSCFCADLILFIISVVLCTLLFLNVPLLPVGIPVAGAAGAAGFAT